MQTLNKSPSSYTVHGHSDDNPVYIRKCPGSLHNPASGALSLFNQYIIPFMLRQTY